MDAPELIKLKEETLRWIFSIVGAIVIYIVIAVIVQALYHPDIDLLKATANNILVDPGTVRPEPVEALLFRLAVVIIIPSIAFFYRVCSKLPRIKTLAEKKTFYLILSVICILFLVALTYFDFSAFEPFGPMGGGSDAPPANRDIASITNFDFYFDGLFMGSYLWLYTLIVVPLVAWLFFSGIRKYNWGNKKSFKLVVSVVGYVIVVGSLIAVILMNIYSFPFSNENKLDFAAVYYSMTQVYAGLPMLVDHFTSTYGLYPQFLNPFFQIIGLNVYKFTMVMSLLTGLSFVLNFYFLKRIVSNKIILFLGFASVLFFSYLDFMLTTIFDSTFSLFPVRYIIPSVLTCLAAWYFEKPSKGIYWTICFVSAAFILWNPEIGLVCYLSWIAVNIYNDFYTAEGKRNNKRILGHFLAGIGVLLAAVCVYELVVFAFYGAWPDVRLLFGTVIVFEEIGLGLLPMVLIHPWNLLSLVLILGFTWSIIKWTRKDVTPKSSLVLLVALIGLGYFVYFQGRSHNSNFALSSGFSLMLLTILGDELWKTIQKHNVFLLNSLFIIFLFLISFSSLEIVFNTRKMVDLVSHGEDKDKQAEMEQIAQTNNEFLLKNSQEHEKILLLAPKKNQALGFDGTKRKGAVNPGFIDLFLKTDLTRLENAVLDSGFSIFMEPGGYMYSYMARTIDAIGATYEFNSAVPNLVLLSKRKNKIPGKSFFCTSDQCMLHRKYIDDSTGLELRMNDGAGIAPVVLPPEFSVEVLFYSVPQLFPNATLVGDIGDSCGFAICNIYNSAQYFCLVNYTAYTVPIGYNQWVYCVFNLYPDHIDVYKNGGLIYTHKLVQSLRNSPAKVSIGKVPRPKEYNNYIGAISEVAIVNRVLDSDQIRNTWMEIKQAVGH